MVSGKVAGLGFVTASIAVVIFLLFSGFTYEEQQVNTVELEVIYGGSFNITITGNGQERFQSSYGFMKTILQRLDGEEWNISVSVQKLDAGSGTIYVRLLDMDGTVLVSDSTNEPLGVVSLALTL